MKNNHPSTADLRALMPFVAALGARVEAATAHIESLYKNENARIEAAVFSGAGAGEGMPRSNTPGDKTANIALSLSASLEEELRPVMNERSACAAVQRQFELALKTIPEPNRIVLKRHGICREPYKSIVDELPYAGDTKAVTALYSKTLESLRSRIFLSREQYAAVTGFPPDDE